MPPIRAVLFDLDGTLLDSIRLILDSYHHALAVHRLPPRSDQQWLAGIGTPLWVQFRDWAHDPDLLDALIATYREHNIANHDRAVSAYPDVVDVVREVRALGARTGLVTSKQRTGADRGLRFLGLSDAMDVVVAVDEVTRPKPHPEPLWLAAERLGIATAEVVYVGDSVHDMECGRAAGARTAAALWGPFGREQLAPCRPDYWLVRPRDLLAVVNGESGTGNRES
jgi:pyrophosphatase PpaX